MEHSITISLEFSFRGNTFKPSQRIDIDTLLELQKNDEALHDLLAHSMGLDHYTYEHDVMLVEEIIFSDASGLIAEHMHEGKPDLDALAVAWQEQQMLDELQAIAARCMQIDDIARQPGLRSALIAAFQAGRNAAKIEHQPIIPSAFR